MNCHLKIMYNAGILKHFLNIKIIVYENGVKKTQRTQPTSWQPCIAQVIRILTAQQRILMIEIAGRLSSVIGEIPL